MPIFDDAAKQRLLDILRNQCLHHPGAGLIRDAALRAAVPLREKGFTELNLSEICTDELDAKLNAIQAENGLSHNSVREGIEAAIAAVVSRRLDESLH